MLYRPSDLSPDRREAFEERALDLRERLLDRVEALLLELPSEAAGDLVYELAFKPGDALPKRDHRPKLDTALLAETVHLESDPDGAALPTVLEFAAAEQEYFDMLDDLVDGDVADGRRGEVVLATQFLRPLAARRLDRLGATEYWSEGAIRLLETPMRERRSEPTADAYRSLLDRQAALYGTTAGVAALAAGAGDGAVDRAAEVGEAVYRFRQVLLDYEQYRGGESEPWNAGAVFDRETVLELLRAERDRVADRTATYDAERAAALRGLVALDVDAWLEKLAE